MYALPRLDQTVLMVSIGNTRIKVMVCSSHLNQNSGVISYAYVHSQLSELSQELSQLFAKIGQPDYVAIASVAPDLLTPWHDLPQTTIITTADVPLQGLYASMGVDRALAAFGAGEVYGYPILVIDAGTAITLTSVNPHRQFFGGAILAGLRSQFAMLPQNIPTLPNICIPDTLPPRWAINNTREAIQAGIAHTILGGLQNYINDWRSHFPLGKVILTGGDGHYLLQWGLPADKLDEDLIFWGMRQIVIV